MTAFRFSERSRKNLGGVHPDLVAVVERALEITKVDFAVIEGSRSKERQRELVRKGASQTMNSRHLTGHAVDIAPFINGTIRWDWPPFYDLADAMKQAARELGVPLDWGGDWRNFKDGPHFQLPWDHYAKDDMASRIVKPDPTPASPFAAFIKALVRLFK